jgi:hypothetical protein|tara:strand:- start:1413 stop:1835 length:423 start_codon:yes stop_codon:yes gene_type:complete
MGFGGGFSSSASRGGLTVVSGSHGQVLRFHEGKGAVIGSNDFTFDHDTKAVGLTGSMSLKGNLSHSGSITPESGDPLGNSNNKYSEVHTNNFHAANVYTGDLHMKNERGDWTVVEEKDALVVRNNLTGERFKLMMEKIND